MKYASVLQRIAAWIIDVVIIGVVVMSLIGIGMMSVIFIGGFGPLALTTMISIFFVVFGYTIILETVWNGQTIGKKALEIRVVKEDGKRITFREAFLRNVLRIIDNQFAGLVGLILIIVTKRKQRIGDLVAKTVVVQD